MSIRIRPEQPDDYRAVHRVHAAAFPTEAEANLVDRLRQAGKAIVSLVAEVDGSVVGHVLFSPVTIQGEAAVYTGLGLAPVAVLPAHQNQGIGGQLITQGLAVCRQLGQPWVVLLGHPSYYPRFGFQRLRASPEK